MNWVIGILLDVVLLGIALLCMKKGSKDGFAKTLVSFAGIFIAVILAVTVCKPAANYVYTNVAQKPIETAIQSSIENQFGELASENPSAQQLIEGLDKAIDSLPEFIKNTLKAEDKKAELTDKINEFYSSNLEEFSINITENFIKPILISILSAIVFVLIFFVVWLLCFILSKALKIVNKIPLLGGVNALLGGIIGFLKGLVIVLLINFIIVSITSSGANIFGIITAETVNSSLIMKNLAVVNPLNTIVNSVLGTK